MQGNLKQVPLPEVLQFISMGKSTGILQLRQGSAEITLSIHNGKIVNSSSLERKRRLGDLLVNRGLLRRSELSRLLNLQKTVESDKRLGEILVEREIVDNATIRETLRLQLEEEVWHLFGWEDGEFKFETVPGDKLGPPIVQIDIEPMILEGTRRNDEWKKIEQYIPHDRVVLATFIDNPDDFERDITLREEEWEVLSKVNGRFSVRAIVSRANMGRFEVHSILTQFVKSGLVRIVQQDPSAFVAAANGADARVAPGAEDPAPRSSGFFGVLSRRPRAGGEESQAYLSPLGAIAHFVTQLVSRVVALKEYKAGPEDSRIVALVWCDLLQVYTRADLARAEGQRIDVSALERYFECCGFAEAIDDCYEDALEALLALLRTIYAHFCRQAGEKAVSRVARELVDEMAPRMTIRFREPFPFAERIQNVLKPVV